ncbi:type II toxin-antitoxin system VapB family antitoxin [uncultured Caulobacter sp.]|uniref:type II toxin-antitoxin system VapB family antitoxin n=1 Tax=uncultured Caulobacter sp. TaxID=158749 RepID=UPI002622F12F|nr:type II toxin-antitoxin system VapB family antitoxin [uncultured Caulobacter sp.]
MRVTVTANQALVAEVMKITGVKTKREAVELGLRTLLNLRRQAAVRGLRGQLVWEGDLDGTRADG